MSSGTLSCLRFWMLTDFQKQWTLLRATEYKNVTLDHGQISRWRWKVLYFSYVRNFECMLRRLHTGNSSSGVLLEFEWWKKSLHLFNLRRHEPEKNSVNLLWCYCRHVVTNLWRRAQLFMVCHLRWETRTRKPSSRHGRTQIPINGPQGPQAN